MINGHFRLTIENADPQSHQCKSMTYLAQCKLSLHTDVRIVIISQEEKSAAIEIFKPQFAAFLLSVFTETAKGKLQMEKIASTTYEVYIISRARMDGQEKSHFLEDIYWVLISVTN